MVVRELIIRELEKLTYKKVAGENVMICCPFHGETQPSCSIHLGTRVPAGTWRCFGCGASGHWNVLAEKLGFQKITQRILDKEDVFAVLGSHLKKQMSIEDMYIPPEGLLQWKDDWRGFPLSFLRQFNPAKWYDKISDEYRIVFFCKVGDELLGHVAGVNTGSKAKPSYLYSYGRWASKALFPYNHLPSTKVVVLVEGVRDALRLIHNGIPALCVYGTQNWSSYKEGLLASHDIKRVLLLMDGDDAGRIASRKIYKTVSKSFSTKVVDLPIKKKKKDQLDPADMPLAMVQKVKHIVKWWRDFDTLIEF